jgi:18S rRNA (guanine1575-N7)-methyltransferase
LVLQVYPENAAQAEMLVGAAMRVGFSGGLVVDYPHSTRAKKYFLVLMVGPSSYVPTAKGLDGSEPMEGEEEEGGQVRVGQRQHKRGGGGKRKHGEGGGKGRGWVLHKKEQMRKKGYTAIPVDSKYTGRKRRKVT